MKPRAHSPMSDIGHDHRRQEAGGPSRPGPLPSSLPAVSSPGLRRRRNMARFTRAGDDAAAGTHAPLSADVLVVGGGPAGTWAAIKAAQTAADVVLVDKGRCGSSVTGPDPDAVT